MKLDELMEKLDVVKQQALANAKTAEEFLDLLKSYGFDGTMEDVKEFFKKVSVKENAELSDDELDDVNGGLDLGYLARILFKNGFNTLIGNLFGDPKETNNNDINNKNIF